MQANSGSMRAQPRCSCPLASATSNKANAPSTSPANGGEARLTALVVAQRQLTGDSILFSRGLRLVRHAIDLRQRPARLIVLRCKRDRSLQLRNCLRVIAQRCVDVAKYTVR